MPRDLSFAIWARVAAFAAATFLQAAALRLERKELEDGLAVGLGLVAMVLVAIVAVAAAPEADEIDAAVVAVVLEGVVEVERAEVAEVAGACELEATVVGVVLEDAATGVFDVATDLVVAVAAAPEADEIDTAVVAVVLEGVVEVERAEVAEVAGACELEATVVGVVLEDAATDVFDVATDDTIACGAASAVAAKSRTRDVGFILMECCRIEKRRLGML
ncbi:hypothetical protein HO173_005044 [Letharia columbiana]|uniref:Uncharacterized protein n=1 Tax=Letharia columbiana TaxID=112416 RepID=A0A8H6L5U4_9LECA|nr:uncharacterized protein HO173_005044 [Letharia columbiana]KAF6236753.1 hypothetical protein HO173_005044 [Letharia columbiana]